MSLAREKCNVYGKKNGKNKNVLKVKVFIKKPSLAKKIKEKNIDRSCLPTRETGCNDISVSLGKATSCYVLII